MLLEELHEHYGTYTDMSRALGLGNTTYLLWQRRGYIPYPSQCVIEVETNRKFKASRAHEKPKKKAVNIIANDCVK